MRGLVDTHSHLQFGEFESDRSDVLERAWEAGLESVVVLGVDVASSEAAIALAEANPQVHPTAGCHPHDAGRLDRERWRRLQELTQHPRVVAVGEIGLDFYRNRSRREDQVRVLERELALAVELRLPVAVHCREAHREMYPILERWAAQARPLFEGGRPLGVMHYFSGSLDLARRYVEMGFLISIHTSVTYPKSERTREVAAGIDLNSLLLETDSPYGAPQSRRGRRNEPACVVEAAACVAGLRGLSIDTVAERTGDNADRLFGLRRVRAKASRTGVTAW